MMMSRCLALFCLGVGWCRAVLGRWWMEKGEWRRGWVGGGAPSSKTKYLLCSCFVAKGGWVRSGEVGSGEVRADHKRCDVFVGVHRAYHNQTQE